MSSLVINRFRYKLVGETQEVTFSAKQPLFFQRDVEFVFKKLNKLLPAAVVENIKADLPEENDQKPKVHFDFETEMAEDCFTLTIPFTDSALSKEVSFLKKAFTKKAIMDIASNEGFLIEPFPTGADLAIYRKNAGYNNDWDIFTRFDVTIYPYEGEVSISIGSNETYVSRKTFPFSKEDQGVRVIDNKDGHIKRAKFSAEDGSALIIANAERRRQLNIKNKPQKIFYHNQYKTLNSIYTVLLNGSNQKIRFESGGFKTVHPSDINQVEFDKNQMLFGRSHKDVNAASGMRDGGPFEVPGEKAKNIKFLFIYQNREQANNLFAYLKKGLKHYPGLLSYVGIAVNVANERLQYTSEEAFVDEFESFVENELPSADYSDYFALVLLPFSRETSDTEENKLYYLIKEKLLRKNIASQLIDSNKINSANFHFHLPNISIAILAKIGGIPWKLDRKSYNELVVGFNEEKYEDDSILGTAVYFDNSGKLKQVRSFQGTKRSELILSLKNSIEEYLVANQNAQPERLVIHYYKPPRRDEMDSIDRLIREEFRFNLPFAFVEINDSKVSSEICFDVEFNYGMPTSGTFVKLKRGGSEYLLFNNQRYWKNPLKPISAEEYPIIVKLYNTESGGFNHKELLSQVYEFSRLYWKGLKQRSQPVTTQYAKMIADFAAHFENGQIPHNPVAQSTAWFI